MKYMVKGELEVKVGGSALLPDLCDLHIGAVLTDESMALFSGHIGSLPCLEASVFPQLLPNAAKHNWWV